MWDRYAAWSGFASSSEGQIHTQRVLERLRAPYSYSSFLWCACAFDGLAPGDDHRVLRSRRAAEMPWVDPRPAAEIPDQSVALVGQREEVHVRVDSH